MQANCGVIYTTFRAALLFTRWLLWLRVMAALFPSAIRLRYLRYHWQDKLARWFYPRPSRRRCPPRGGGAYDGGFFKLHFQYLCAFDETRHYDYFAITAGPMSLRKRFCNRKPSKQVQKIAYNRYREIA